MSPRDNRPSISAASTQSPPPPSSSSSSTNQAAAAAAAVVSNLADSIDTVADHFSPAHTIHQSVVQTSNQPANQLSKKQLSKKQPGSIASLSASTIEANQEGISVEISQPINQPTNQLIKKEEEPVEQLMNETLITESTGKNSLFGYEMPFDAPSAAYAALVAAGGIIGYVKAGSIPSLAAGLTFGGILGIGAYLTSVNPDNYYLTLATSTGLGGLMGYRFINSGKFMPAGLIALLSIGMVARFTVRALTSSPSLPHAKE